MSAWARNGGASFPFLHSISFLFREGAAATRVVKDDTARHLFFFFLRFTVIRRFYVDNDMNGALWVTGEYGERDEEKEKQLLHLAYKLKRL